MNLERELMFTDRTDIDDYLNESILNKELYDLYIQIKDVEYYWKHTSIETFNEVYYQCTRIFNDPHPEENIYTNYLDNAKNTLGTRYASNLVFAIVNAIFCVMKQRPANVDYFQNVYDDSIRSDNKYYNEFLSLASRFIDKHGYVDLKFPFNPCCNNIGIHQRKDWVKITNDFDQKTIIKIIDRFSKALDKKFVLSFIENAFESENDNEEILPF